MLVFRRNQEQHTKKKNESNTFGLCMCGVPTPVLLVFGQDLTCALRTMRIIIANQPYDPTENIGAKILQK